MNKEEQENFDRLCDKIANKVVAKIVNLQSMLDWHDAMHAAKLSKDYDKLDMTDEDKDVGELAKLMTIMNMFQDREEYEKCAIINKMIKRLKTKLSNE
tara:strand:+ start:371 stop:664 length:294 start_codon:yes stop_codon:yes gene_type:complete